MAATLALIFEAARGAQAGVVTGGIGLARSARLGNVFATTRRARFSSPIQSEQNQQGGRCHHNGAMSKCLRCKESNPPFSELLDMQRLPVPPRNPVASSALNANRTGGRREGSLSCCGHLRRGGAAGSVTHPALREWWQPIACDGKPAASAGTLALASIRSFARRIGQPPSDRCLYEARHRLCRIPLPPPDDGGRRAGLAAKGGKCQLTQAPRPCCHGKRDRRPTFETAGTACLRVVRRPAPQRLGRPPRWACECW